MTPNFEMQLECILHKLTEENIEDLVPEIQKLLIIEPLEAVQRFIDVLFENVVVEPHSAVLYAQLCGLVFTRGKIYLDFQRCITQKCKAANEKFFGGHKARDAQIKADLINALPSERAVMLTAYEQVVRYNQQRSVGIVQFMGELFRVQKVSMKIIRKCIHYSLECRDDCCLESLYKLLAIIGKGREKEMRKMFAYCFVSLQSIVDSKKNRISLRTLCVIQNLIELRNIDEQEREI